MAIINAMAYYAIYGGGTSSGTKLTLTNSTLTEESSPVGTIVSTYTLTTVEGETVTVGFASGSNDDNYYELSGTNVLLTSTGFDALNLSTKMPNVRLTTSDGLTKGNLVTTVFVDDETFLTVNDGTVTQYSTVAGDIVCNFTASDEDNVLTFDFTSGTNTGGYYSLSGFNVLLTSSGENYLNNGNELPNVSITTNTNKTSSNTITTVLTEEPTNETFVWSDQWEMN